MLRLRETYPYTGRLPYGLPFSSHPDTKPMEISANLSLSYVMPQQAQKHVTVNESFRRLDAITQLSVLSDAVDTQPADPADGDRYLVPQGATGAVWAQFQPGSIAAFQDDAWTEIVPKTGWRAFAENRNSVLIFDGIAWTPITANGSPTETSSVFGINTAADATNRLAVKSDAILFSHDDVTPGSGDCRFVLNKAASGGTASLLFQRAFAGQVELGLLGKDHFGIQVSDDDGASFDPVLSIDPASNEITLSRAVLGDGIRSAELHFSTSNADPFWAIGQATDSSFFIQRRSGGFGTGGKVLIYDENGALGLWGAPSAKGKIATVSNINVDGVENILYLEQTALSPVSGIARFHNNEDNATPILRCTTDTKTVLSVPADGTVLFGLPLQLVNKTVATLPDAAQAGAGALVFVSDAAGGNVPAFSDGAQWRRMTDRAIVS